MDLGAGLGRRGADFSCWRPTYGFVETQGNVGGRSHWPGMWRVPAWGELEWPCSSQEGLDDYGSYILLLPNQNHLNREQINQLDQGKITDRKIAADRGFIQPQLKTGTECGVVPTHPVGELEEFPHIPLQKARPPCRRATQPILSLKHIV